MEITKRDVDELNELAEKITGTNPGATTTAQALNYIEQNYNSNNAYYLDVDLGMQYRYFGDATKYGTTITITNEDDIAKLVELEKQVNNGNTNILINYNNWIISSYLGLNDDKFYGIQANVIDINNLRAFCFIIKKTSNDGEYQIVANVFTLQSVSA